MREDPSERLTTKGTAYAPTVWHADELKTVADQWIVPSPLHAICIEVMFRVQVVQVTGVAVAMGVLVGVSVLVAVPVRVGLLVRVAVEVLVPVRVADTVPVAVRMAVTVLVTVG